MAVYSVFLNVTILIEGVLILVQRIQRGLLLIVCPTRDFTVFQGIDGYKYVQSVSNRFFVSLQNVGSCLEKGVGRVGSSTVAAKNIFVV